jgi:hypothetical protein
MKIAERIGIAATCCTALFGARPKCAGRLRFPSSCASRPAGRCRKWSELLSKWVLDEGVSRIRTDCPVAVPS